MEMDTDAINNAARYFALGTCIRALIAAHEDSDMLRDLLVAARKDFMEILQPIHLQQGSPEAYSRLTLKLDHLLFGLTSGLVGESPLPSA